MTLYALFGALIPLNNFGHYLNWGVIHISIANFLVICLMVATFVAALVLPFPGRSRRKENK